MNMYNQEQSVPAQSAKRPRVDYLDYARGFAVFTMFLQHSMLVHESTLGETTLLGIVFVLLGTAPAAPVFLFLMGVFQAQWRASLPRTLVRGVTLSGLGYLLNFLRGTLPMLLSGETSFPPGDSPLENLFAVDILQTAGLSLIIGGLCKSYLPRWVWVLLAVGNIFLAPLLWQVAPLVSPENLLWGASPQVAFPLFPWLFYPLVGLLIGDLVVDPRWVVQHRSVFFGVLVGLAILSLVLMDVTPICDYVRSGAGVHAGLLAFMVLWLGLLQRLSQMRFRLTKTARVLCYWSRNITSIYFIQWVLFGWSTLLLGGDDKPDYLAALIGFFILLITHYLMNFERIRRLFP